ncbi:MAG: hypothetical protein ACRDJY_10685 [Thermoleophilaceae bacterium]
MRRGHAIALVGALLLLLVMALDWYSTATGDEARRIESITDNPSGAEAGEVDRRLNEDAREIAEGEEENAWQADALIDRIILILLLLAIVFAVLTAITRASGAKPTKGIGPAGAAALFAAAGAALVAYRIIQEPGLDAATNVKAGAPLALVGLAMIALGSSSALRADEKEAADAGAD